MQILNKTKNRRGSLFDVIFIIAALFGLALFIGVIAYVFPQITSQIGATDIGQNNASAQALAKTDSNVGNLGYIFMIVFVGLSIGLFITAYQIESIPALVPVYILILALLILVASVMQFTYTSFSANPSINSTENPIVSLLMSKLIIITVGLGVISMILIFAKPRGGGYGGF